VLASTPAPPPQPPGAAAPSTPAALATAASGPPAGAPTPAATVKPAAALAEPLALFDAAWARRDEPGGLEEVRVTLAAAVEAEPTAYAVLWRQARLEAWLSEDPSISDGQKSKLGKRAWDLAEQAIAADAKGVEGYFYAVAGMGNYSLGIGIVSALMQGIEGKFKDRLTRAEQLQPDFQSGAVPTAWGRFYFKLPWPKHDGKKSRAALERALAMNPDNVRARVYLGDLQLDEGRKDAAREAFQAALAKPPGQYDAPEERRWQGVARASLERLARK